MSRTDLIADACTMIRNAILARKENLDIPASTTLKAMMEILKSENYIDAYKLIEGKAQGTLRVYLKYVSGKPAIRGIKRISSPSHRRYVKKEKIPRVLRGRGLAILTTPKGILTDNQARETGIGGEVICHVW